MKKIIVILKWFLLVVPVGLFAIITAPVVFPLYDWTNWKWLWIYGDDSRIENDGSYASDYKMFLLSRNNGILRETFSDRYKWCGQRNVCWNLRTWIENKQIGDGTGKTEIEYSISELILDGQVVLDGGLYNQDAGIKYEVPAGEDPWQGWLGSIISFKYSILGKSLIWLKVDGIYSFRYSYCKLILGRWITFKINCVKSDAVLHIKTQRQTP